MCCLILSSNSNTLFYGTGAQISWSSELWLSAVHLQNESESTVILASIGMLFAMIMYSATAINIAYREVLLHVLYFDNTYERVSIK